LRWRKLLLKSCESFKNRFLDGDGDMENKGCCCGNIDESHKDNPGRDEGCCCGETVETSESTEDNQNSTNEKKQSKIFGLADSYELFVDPAEDDGCGCCCGGDYPDESIKNNPSEPETIADENFMEKLENYAYSIGITSIGYAQVLPELINEGKSILFNNAIVLTMEMDEELIKTDPGAEAQALNDAHYEKLGNMTHQVADYLRENGFAAESAHPYGGVVKFTPLAQEAGLGWIGQSALLISPASGPRQKISAVFTSIENLPIKHSEYAWITEYCEKCGKCIKACPEKALVEKKGCCGSTDVEFVQKLCIGCSQGCTYCIEACPFDEKGYEYVKNRFDKMNAKLKEKEKFKGDVMVKDEDKAFEAEIKAKYSGGTCPCQVGVLEKKKSSLKEVVCKKCGAVFKTNRDTDYCWRCEKK